MKKDSKVKNAFNKRIRKIEKDGFKSIKRDVEPVAKDTNKKRRKMKKPASGNIRKKMSPCL